VSGNVTFVREVTPSISQRNDRIVGLADKVIKLGLEGVKRAVQEGKSGWVCVDLPAEELRKDADILADAFEYVPARLSADPHRAPGAQPVSLLGRAKAHNCAFDDGYSFKLDMGSVPVIAPEPTK